MSEAPRHSQTSQARGDTLAPSFTPLPSTSLPLTHSHLDPISVRGGQDGWPAVQADSLAASIHHHHLASLTAAHDLQAARGGSQFQPHTLTRFQGREEREGMAGVA